MADEERQAVEKDEITLLDMELQWLTNPTSPSYTLAMVWQEQMLNRPEHATAILKDAAAHGMPLPQP